MQEGSPVRVWRSARYCIPPIYCRAYRKMTTSHCLTEVRWEGGDRLGVSQETCHYS